jgi:hypothetical protein
MQLDAPKLKFTGIEDQSRVWTAEMSDFKIVLELNANHTAGGKKTISLWLGQTVGLKHNKWI